MEITVIVLFFVSTYILADLYGLFDDLKRKHRLIKASRKKWQK